MQGEDAGNPCFLHLLFCHCCKVLEMKGSHSAESQSMTGRKTLAAAGSNSAALSGVLWEAMYQGAVCFM